MDNKILTSLSYGLYAIGVKESERPSACIVNTLFQITVSPPVIAVSLNHDNYTNACIRNTGRFSVSVLSENTPAGVIGTLGFKSGADTDKLKNISYEISSDNLPIIKENSCCWFNCKVVDKMETATHTLFLAEVYSGSNEIKGIPMTYKYYHEVIKGSAPPKAPTYQPKSDEKLSTSSYVCKVCGYVYNDPKIPFESLPDSWCCPICKVSKSEFKLI